MPKIPTYTATARTTKEVGAIKSGIQVSQNQTVAGALQPITEYAIKSKQTYNKITRYGSNNQMISYHTNTF